MQTPLAWLNLVHQKKRTAVAVAGVGFAVLLIFMQLGFYGSAEGTATILFDELDFQVILASAHYAHIFQPGNLPRERLAQAHGVAGVGKVVPLSIGYSTWRNPDAYSPTMARMPQRIMILGIQPADEVFRRGRKGVQELIDRHRSGLQIPGKGLVDSCTHSEFGRTNPPRVVEVGTQRLEVIGQFTLGTGFAANGLILVGDRTFCNLVPAFPAQRVSLGLVKLDEGIAPEEAKDRLAASLPPDVQVWTREQIEQKEKVQWVRNTSIGLIFSLGVAVAFGVGLVFVYQVIASDVSNRLHEFATLKALGYTMWSLGCVVLQQAVLVALSSYVPGLLGALALYSWTAGATGIPIFMTIPRACGVFVLTVIMCSLSGLLAVRKVQLADPADLF